ncbi:MAG: alpha-mannosidase [Candidatus Hydrogenedentes bacterium]|nr:alpha-mannosidase [Candidatus Hydrogenedentota bacterium]
MKQLHLICNAHLDPYWLWEWEEGAAEALSTFRTAADFCDEHDGFVFNHNEVILYRWVEEYEPILFARIQRLVTAGKWHIMGGWYLQPDCNMPSGESFVRQILMGRLYFKEKFGVEPTTAINFDPFGHTRGLVQILAKSGFDSYLHCRPDQKDCPLPDAADYIWVGYDGSEVAAHRTLTWYGTPRTGMIKGTLEKYLDEHSEREVGLFTWGVGNHGGGPSRVDLKDITAIIEKNPDFPIIHSTPEAYFGECRDRDVKRPRHEGDINAWAVGCYTSQIRIKQKHRLLENELYAVEKMISTAALQGRMNYPQDELREALHDLLVAEFHDILPGSSVPAVEDAGLRLLEHGLEIISRLKARVFFALADGQAKGSETSIPVFIYNPHPYPLEGIFQCEFNLPNARLDGTFTQIHACYDGTEIPCQVEQEISNLSIDWRKRCLLQVRLKPSQMNRIDCRLEVLDAKPAPVLAAQDGAITFETEELSLFINGTTGLIDRYLVKGVEYLRPGAFQPIVMNDSVDPWETRTMSFRDPAGNFTLMSPEDGTKFSGLDASLELPSVRVVEDGPVRSVVEALLHYGDSFLVLIYRLPKQGTEVEVHVRVYWNEKNKLLKLAIPIAANKPQYWGQVAYGCDILPGEKREVVAQKWTAAISDSDRKAVTLINDGIYGSDFVEGEIRPTLLRSPAYSALPLDETSPLVPPDRMTPRIDQGERQYTFWINAGDRDERLEKIDREALAHNEKPMALSFYPSGAGEAPSPGVLLSDDVVQMAAFKRSEGSDAYILRLFEPTGVARTTNVSIPSLGISQKVAINRFEIKSFLVDPSSKTLAACDLLERAE